MRGEDGHEYPLYTSGSKQPHRLLIGAVCGSRVVLGAVDGEWLDSDRELELTALLKRFLPR